MIGATHTVIDYSVGEIRHPADLEAENHIGTLLAHHYPHVSWFVEADGETGIVHVQMPDVHKKGNEEWGFVLHLQALKGWDDMKKKAIWAGGELLERANISRTHATRYSDKVDRD
jgi:hypothetical protein